MKLLKTFIDPNFPHSGKEIQVRKSVRIVLIDAEGRTPVIHAKKYNHYKIPGGGIDKGEDVFKALRREALEEAGCEIEILDEVGAIQEQRIGGKDEGLYNLDQISYCYYGRVISQASPSFTDFEKENDFGITWLSFEEAFERFKNCSPKSEAAKIMNERDFIFLCEGYKLLEK